jgi:catechol 2,3-dioxygenase-like lactoylglutathione lyase family enzyme
LPDETGDEIMIIGLSHANIRVRDIDACLPFYVDVLGLKVTLDERGQQVSERLTDRRRAVFLRWGEGPKQSFVVLQSIPIVEGETVPELHGHQARLWAMGLNHFGFWVDDLEPILARAEKAGVQLARATVTCVARHYGYDDPSDAPCVRTAQMADPEGNVIQLEQWVGAAG